MCYYFSFNLKSWKLGIFTQKRDCRPTKYVPTLPFWRFCFESDPHGFTTYYWQWLDITRNIQEKERVSLDFSRTRNASLKLMWPTKCTIIGLLLWQWLYCTVVLFQGVKVWETLLPCCRFGSIHYGRFYGQETYQLLSQTGWWSKGNPFSSKEFWVETEKSSSSKGLKRYKRMKDDSKCRTWEMNVRLKLGFRFQFSNYEVTLIDGQQRCFQASIDQWQSSKDDYLAVTVVLEHEIVKRHFMFWQVKTIFISSGSAIWIMLV